ncbi:hypothetical protein F511_16845 [Dorcoceras hygrometricum]|uniref:Uncharacterized protein n=1 Tax=Dorcoceras hygrometricum TaxID=472368 RepID=A0A2Z7CDY1_9LAMI|nr:hypothetical protein F511_16845 [Dorcoceras hygrometricum]
MPSDTKGIERKIPVVKEETGWEGNQLGNNLRAQHCSKAVVNKNSTDEVSTSSVQTKIETSWRTRTKLVKVKPACAHVLKVKKACRSIK